LYANQDVAENDVNQSPSFKFTESYHSLLMLFVEHVHGIPSTLRNEKFKTPDDFFTIILLSFWKAIFYVVEL